MRVPGSGFAWHFLIQCCCESVPLQRGHDASSLLSSAYPSAWLQLCQCLTLWNARSRKELGSSYIWTASAGVVSIHLGGLGMASSALYSSLICRYVTSRQWSICCCRPSSIGVELSFMFSLQIFGSTRLSMMSSACNWMKSYWQSMSKSTSPPATLSAIRLRQSSLDQFAVIKFL